MIDGETDRRLPDVDRADVDGFGLRDRVIADYASYIQSFFTIRDERIRQLVDDALRQWHLWLDSLLHSARRLNRLTKGKSLGLIGDSMLTRLHAGVRTSKVSWHMCVSDPHDLGVLPR